MIYAYINSDIAPLYTSAGQSGELADELLYGMKVFLEDTPSPGWHKARTHYNYDGFVQDRYLYIPSENLKPNENELDDKSKIVTAPYIDILAEPKVQAKRLACAPRGGFLSVIGEPDGGWQQVSLADGRQGYTKAGHLSPSPGDWRTRKEEELRQALTESAKSYLGAQYRWGGKTILGIDCSGLTAMAYMLNGVIIYRDARIMPDFPVHEISWNTMGAGDLMFFKGHVAMYLGDDMFIHSTAFAGSDGVVINSVKPNHAKYPYRKDLMDTLYAIGSIF